MLKINQISEGYLILITGLFIVFSALLLLVLFFKYGLPILLKTYKTVTKKRVIKIDKQTSSKSEEEFTGEIAAAISAAVYLYLKENHDDENAVLTIKQARKLYSPWSSKIYSTYNRLSH
jgi:Na+-transporting methylmalonyl-CoA/oxaloacetate decarboxylase gamma subunit